MEVSRGVVECVAHLARTVQDLGAPVIINLMGGAVKRRRAGESGKCDPVFDVITTGHTYAAAQPCLATLER